MKPPPSGMEMDDLPKGELPPHLELQRTRVVCAADAPSYVSPLSVCLSVSVSLLYFCLLLRGRLESLFCLFVVVLISMLVHTNAD
jgi:hypothetical protein